MFLTTHMMTPMHSLPGREAAIPNPALGGWCAVIGEWASIGSHPYLPGKTPLGRTPFAWLEGGALLIMRSEIDEPEIPSGIAVVGTDDATGEQFMLYFDERGVSRKYDVTTSHSGWTWSRDSPELAQRFTATLTADGNRIVGKGEMSKN